MTCVTLSFSRRSADAPRYYIRSLREEASRSYRDWLLVFHTQGGIDMLL